MSTSVLPNVNKDLKPVLISTPATTKYKGEKQVLISRPDAAEYKDIYNKIQTRDVTVDLETGTSLDSNANWLNTEKLASKIWARQKLNFLTESWDQLLEKIPKHISNQYIDVPEGRVYFDNISWQRPLITPLQALTDGQDYFATMYATPFLIPAIEVQKYIQSAGRYQVQRVQISSGPSESQGKIKLLEMPVLIGSRLCRTWGVKDPDQVLGMGICPYQATGWTIVGGTRFIIRLQEQMRLNRIFVFTGPELKASKTPNRNIVLQARMTYATASGSNLVYMYLDKDGAIEVYLQFMGRRYTGSAIGEYMTLPIFSLFRIVQGTSYSTNDIIEQIVALSQRADTTINGMDNTNIATRIRQALIPTEAKISGIANDIIYLTKNTQAPIDALGGRDYLINRINETLFSFAKDDLSLKDRLYMLLIMASNLLMVKIGARPEDDKNSWANKRIVTPADQMETLFKAYWIRVMGNLQAEADKSKPSARTIVGHFDADWLTKRIRKNFSTGKWGVEETNTKDNVTMVLQITNAASTWDELKKVLIPTKDRNTNGALRNNHLSQFGFICPAHTPEGQNCGLVKNMAALATVSMTRDEILIKRIITGQFAININNQWVKTSWLLSNPVISNSLKVMLNGKFLGFSKVELYDYLISAKRSGQGINYDTSIVKDLDQFLHIYTDSSRPIRPLLIANSDQTLVINQKNGWDLTIDQMLVQGMLEYVDPHEQEYFNLAQSVDDMQLIKYGQASLQAQMVHLKNELKDGTSQVEKAEPELASLIRQREQLIVDIELANLDILKLEKDDIINKLNQNKIDLDNEIKLFDLEHPYDFTNRAKAAAEKQFESEEGTRLHKTTDQKYIDYVIKTYTKLYSDKFYQERLQPIYNKYSLINNTLTNRLDDINLILAKYPNFDIVLTKNDKANLVNKIVNGNGVNGNGVNGNGVNGNGVNNIDISSLIMLNKTTTQPMVDKLAKIDNKIYKINNLINQTRDTKINLLNKQYLFNKLYTTTSGTNSVDGGNSIINIKQRAYYTHCEPDPAGIMSISSNLVVRMHSDQGARGTFQAKMNIQAQGIPSSGCNDMTDKTSKILLGARPAIVRTYMNSLLNLDKLPIGDYVMLAIMPWYGYNQEDSVILNQASIDKGKFMTKKEFTISYTLSSKMDGKSDKTSKDAFYEEFYRPVDKVGKPLFYLDEQGIPFIKAEIGAKQIILGIRRRYPNIKNDQGQEYVEDISIKTGFGEHGVVDWIRRLNQNSPNETIIIKLYQIRKPEEGDKFAIPHAQKVTFSLAVSQEDLPQVIDGPMKGLIPDMIINMHSIPSRMAVGMMQEMLLTTIGAELGRDVDASMFRPLNLDHLKRSLVQFGYNEYGLVNMINGTTGEQIKAQIFMGPCYALALKHNVLDKAQVSTDIGRRDQTTHQGLKGRKLQGNLRFGEMERDNLIGHAAPFLLKEIFCLSSDRHEAYLCFNCGAIATVEMQPLVQGESGEAMTGNCRVCDNKKHFAVITVPFVYIDIINHLAMANIRLFHQVKAVEQTMSINQV